MNQSQTNSTPQNLFPTNPLPMYPHPNAPRAVIGTSNDCAWQEYGKGCQEHYNYPCILLPTAIKTAHRSTAKDTAWAAFVQFTPTKSTAAAASPRKIFLALAA